MEKLEKSYLGEEKEQRPGGGKELGKCEDVRRALWARGTLSKMAY